MSSLRLLFLMVTLMLVQSCAQQQSRETLPDWVDQVNEDVAAEAKNSSFEIIKSTNDSAFKPAETQMVPGTGQFINKEAASRPIKPPPEDGKITLNFEGQEIQEVIRTILDDLLQENYVIGPGVSGKVTFSTAKPLAYEQLIPILEMILGWSNAALVKMDGRYHILPTNQAIPGNLLPRIGSINDKQGYQVRVVPLKYIAPVEMEKILQPFASEGAVVRADNQRGLLILAGTARELNNYLQTVEIFDVDWLDGMSVGIYPLELVEADIVVTELEQVFGEGAESPLSGMFRFVAMERLNAIMVITPQSDYLRKAGEWIDRLDRGGSEASSRLYVYNVQNVKALDLADTLNDVFGGSSNSRRRRGPRGKLAPGLRATEISSRGIRQQGGANTRNTNNRQANRQGNRSRNNGGISVGNAENVKITAVEESNALLIGATPSQYESILSAIKRLDVVPLQVLIEVQIIEVTLNESLNYGVEWFFEGALTQLDLSIPVPEDDNNLTPPPTPKAFVTEQQSGFISAAGGRYGFSGGDMGAVITALEFVGDVRSLASPSLLVLNNKEATITVGDQIPVTSTTSLAGTGGNVTSSVQFRNTGTTLAVTPRVNPGGLVFMEISQEVSSPNVDTDLASGGNIAVSTRNLTTEVAVQSGSTIVLGGLIRETGGSSKSGVPILSRIPLIGGLFGSHKSNNDRVELLLLITPKVIRNDTEARNITAEYKKKFKGLRPLEANE